MKARVKATGKIVEVDIYTITKRGKMFGEVTDSRRLCKPDSTFRKFYRDEIEFLSYEDTPDYWTRLEHQAAIAAMGGICGNTSYDEFTWEIRAEDAIRAAHALVEKLKESK